MIARAKYIGSRIQCHILGILWLGFSIPCYGFPNPTWEKVGLWHTNRGLLKFLPFLFVKIVETKYHFELWTPTDQKKVGAIRISDRLLSFSVKPLSKNTDDIVAWLKTLDGKNLEIKEPLVKKPWPVPYYKAETGIIYEGELYAEVPGMKDYRDQVTILTE